MRKSRYSTALVALGVAAVVSASSWFGLFDAWQEKIFDRLFVRTGPPPHVLIVAIDDESIRTIGDWPWPRAVFAQALGHLSGARAIGIDVSFSEPSRYGGADDAALSAALSSTNAYVPVQFDDRGGKVTMPTPELNASKLGFVNVRMDADGVVRHIDTVRPPYRSLAAQLAGGAAYPAQFRIHYGGPTKTIPTIPFTDVVGGKVPEQVFHDETVLIGVTAHDLHDYADTPFGSMPGVEILGNAVGTLANGTYLTDVPRPLGVVLVFLMCGAVYLLVLRMRRFATLAVSVFGVFVGALLLSAAAFSYGVLLPILYLLLAVVLTAVSLNALLYVTESKERRFIEKTFSYYLMPEIIEELVKDPSKLRLGGEKRTLAILFSDIRGFTTISETLSPEALTVLMNEYLTAMTDVIMEHKGLVDKYIGDAIMAFWGAPVVSRSMAEDACAAALHMSKKLTECNAVWKERGIPELHIGIGINVGEMVVGNMGSQKRFNYTVMGDEVNFGSRLEGITKSYGVECIVSESTAKAVEHDSRFTLRELDLVMVKGKKEPKRIYELVTTSVTKVVTEQLKYFAAGRSAYDAGLFKEASEHFQRALALGEDGPSQTFLERCKHLLTHPPEQWTGVFEFTTK